MAGVEIEAELGTVAQGKFTLIVHSLGDFLPSGKLLLPCAPGARGTRGLSVRGPPFSLPRNQLRGTLRSNTPYPSTGSSFLNIRNRFQAVA